MIYHKMDQIVPPFKLGSGPLAGGRQVAGVWSATVDAVRSCGARASFLSDAIIYTEMTFSTM
jgi:hypothetical protein